ncbi:hypothetical protein [Leifsonia aquatica]|uniref:phage tail tube protein n=1 Tax=Leifsonia aquatica TaxID=144185 RepID=UPI00046914A1|nr:hypothetical protein [Leifsonia aquatica]
MTNKRILTNKHYAWFVGPASAVADVTAITETEAATLKNITDAVKFDGTDFNTKSSQSSDDRSFADAAGAKSAGNGDFGGNFSGFKAQPDDTASSYFIAETMLKPYGSDVILLARPVEAASKPLVAGDEYNAWHVLSDAPKDVRGDTSYSWADALLPQSDMGVRGIIAPAAPVKVAVTVAAGDASGKVGSVTRLKAVYQGKIVTIGAKWSTSDPSIATVTEHGIVERLKIGEAKITASFPGALPSDETAITVTA